MMNILKISFYLFSFVSLVSCKNSNILVEKNNRSTIQTADKLREKNRNAFYINAAHSNFSYVWTYEKDKILIYELLKGKIIKERTYATKDNGWMKKFLENDLKELDPCLELDGDIIGIKLMFGDNKINDNVPVNLKCLNDLKYKSVFLEHLIKDMNKYDIRLW